MTFHINKLQVLGLGPKGGRSARDGSNLGRGAAGMTYRFEVQDIGSRVSRV